MFQIGHNKCHRFQTIALHFQDIFFFVISWIRPCTSIEFVFFRYYCDVPQGIRNDCSHVDILSGVGHFPAGGVGSVRHRGDGGVVQHAVAQRPNQHQDLRPHNVLLDVRRESRRHGFLLLSDISHDAENAAVGERGQLKGTREEQTKKVRTFPPFNTCQNNHDNHVQFFKKKNGSAWPGKGPLGPNAIPGREWPGN